MMENMNVADVLGTLFLIYGVIDGYRKGFVKKGIHVRQLYIDTGNRIYGIALCGRFLSGNPAICLFTGKCAGDGQRNLYHAGIKRPG